MRLPCAVKRLDVPVLPRTTRLDVQCLDFHPRQPASHSIGREFGSEFTADAVRSWLARMKVKTLYIEPGSPWENGYVESFNGTGQSHLNSLAEDSE